MDVSSAGSRMNRKPCFRVSVGDGARAGLDRVSLGGWLWQRQWMSFLFEIVLCRLRIRRGKAGEEYVKARLSRALVESVAENW